LKRQTDAECEAYAVASGMERAGQHVLNCKPPTKALAFQYSAGQRTASCLAGRKAVRQICINLLGNATIKFTAQGSVRLDAALCSAGK
jgi:hypothetical protein